MSYYAFSAFFNFFTSIAIGLFILLGNKKNKANFSFFLFALAVSLWSLAYCVWQISTTPELALLFTRILMACAIYIPVTYMHFVCNFLDLKRRKFLIASYLLFTVFLVFDFTPLFVNHIEPYLGFPFWPFAGSVFGLFLLFWFAYVFYASLLLFERFKISEGLDRSRIKFIFFGTVFGFLGGSTNFFMWYHIPVPPIFNIFVSVYVAMTAYSIVRFKSFDIKLIGAQALVWALVITIGSEFFFVSDVTDKILISITLVISSGIGLLLIRSVKKEVLLRENLETANAGQANLIHIMNHQIKGYLGKNKDIFAELLTDDYGAIPEAAKPLVEKGLEEADAGVKYVTDILRGASAENGTLPYDMQKIDFKNIVTDVAGKEKEIAEKKGLKFDLAIADGDYSITGDTVQLGEALRNLMENSIYYTPAGNIWANLARRADKIIFSIKDTGVGVKAEDKPKIFKAGGVGKDSIKINIKSSGYGLAFVKGVVEAHHGRVWFESAGEGKGSTFFMELPVK